MISSQLACQLSQLRALLWYHRGHGFKSHTSQNLFRPNFYYCSLSSVHYCEGRFHIHFFIQSSDIYMIFIYSQSLIHQFPGLLGNKRNDQLPVGLLAQLVEHCTGIAKAMDSYPIQAGIFFRPYFHFCFGSVHYCKHRFHIQNYIHIHGKDHLIIQP